MRPFSSASPLPTIVILAAVVSSARADDVISHSNAEKYSDKKPATKGRSGTASVAVRALIDRENHTVLDITTGDLESAEPPTGRIVKAQIKGLTASGEAAFTHNYNGLDQAAVVLEADDYRRGQPLQIQTNVRGIDGARTDVVMVTEVVRRRPDLAVSRLDVPAEGVRGLPLNLSAAVAELNGDAGARASCVLYVDGVEVDRSNGIWVDAGDDVSCAFTHVFDVAGRHTVAVAAGDVAPGDWDDSNNSASAAIQIDERFHRVEATFSDTESSSTSVSRGGYTSPNAGYDYETRATRTGWDQWGLYRAYLFDTAIPFPMDGAASITDGTQETRFVFTNVKAEYTTGNPDGYCTVAQRSPSPMGQAVYHFALVVCNVRGMWWTIVDFQRYSGVVTYFSSGTNRFWRRVNGTIVVTEDSWSSNSSSGLTQRLRGPRISYDVSLTSGGTEYRWPLVIQMTPFNTEWNEPEVCDDWGSGRDCWSSAGYRRGLSGSVVVGLPDPRTQP